MGKRSSFERIPRDFYPTPYEAVEPLVAHLPYSTFAEPCAGDGSLVAHLMNWFNACTLSSDIEPKSEWVDKKDAFQLTKDDFHGSDVIITNPPWDRKILHPMINHFRVFKPTWLLFDADWMHTKQSKDYIKFCKKIVSVGRLKWIPDSKMTGKDNCAWYLFIDNETTTEFIGR